MHALCGGRVVSALEGGYDLDALAGLEAIGPIEPVKRSFARSYRFPLQETKLRPGKGATAPGEAFWLSM